MKIKARNGKFKPCPEYRGQGVCVDVTPLRQQHSQYGQRNVFKLVFEVNLGREDGTRFCVWSQNFTPSLNEKANLRKFLRAWYGRDLSEAELEEFDTESLIGRPAELVVVHEHRDGETYANIVACTPDKSAEPLRPCGKFVRMKDRQPEDGAQPGQDKTPAPAPADPGAILIHVGKCKGMALRDLAPEQVKALVERWLPMTKTGPTPTPEDRRLIAALESWHKPQNDDDVPF